ncbi:MULTISPECIES: pyridoxal-dependent decarboxylase [unclassified Tolypothrix]|uniref:pyridoxal-dependent decarboxylase n=1 Tax=unclassified Tolypothrix TaxID=2649714 RepID=UPI0005EAA527|nr:MULTISPECIES: pyridoxal-dependent decarboxylase [unclassified Tolypothrix]BAY93258.1 aromatic-L-amino-acid decarboxylase [Microchaete diplosiphon NIES-3275]EKF00179.1 tyrosine decarboxylase family protein [Tolypothrix sp. PCC 7601]MBE9083158.1 aspartate aminotransferase family protein [Tolypothrix sp. LEGE 11397]UYD27126.1 aspartate aminotransferase family protein [Tolypothrix sp. PCC 7712]UYD37015.1 aspartate aminotransferase family protein [Tolypothrix sp. PCC 7601]
MENHQEYHMSSDEFRYWGYKTIDWIANYLETVDKLSVLSQVEPGEIRAKLPETAPLKGESFANILQDLDEIIIPGLTHWQSPNFFAFFPTGISAPSILGELVNAGLGVQGMLWATSPACTELETHVLDWLVDMLELPSQFKSSTTGGGVIQDSASSASLVALIAAREQSKGDINNLVAYTSTQAHSSIEKAAKVAGIRPENFRLIEVDAGYRMRPELLHQQIVTDIESGLTPFYIAATVGTTSSHAIDPLTEIGAIAQTHNIWFHVDGAMSGTAAICPEYRWVHQGLELADSYCFNPHKWMLTNFDCTCFYVKNRTKLIQALSIMPEYLKNQASMSGKVIDYRDWQIPLGRRFRSLKLWFVIRHYGIEGLQHYIRKHIALAQEFAEWVKSHPHFDLVVNPPLNLVCFRHQAGDAINQKIINHINSSGDIYLTSTQLEQKLTLRMSVGQATTDKIHVQKAWELICQTADEIVNQ